MAVYFDNRQEEMEIDSNLLKILESVVNLVLKKQGINTPVEVSISFVDNREIQALNKTYRNIDKSTDVLSFPLIEAEEVKAIDKLRGEILLGDIIISIPKTLVQAEEYGHSFTREVSYLTVHGMLHLLGYDHMNSEEKTIMREKEKEVMKDLKINR